MFAGWGINFITKIVLFLAFINSAFMKKRFLFLMLMSGLVLMNACLKEHSQESGNGPSQGTLQDDGTGNCLPKTVNGNYVAGVALAGTTNYIEVEVDVTTIGNYTIYTDTVNGMYFRVSGVFTATGLTTVRLKGNGTPIAIGISNFVVNYGTSACTIAVTVTGTLAVFTLDGAPGGCMGATTAGTYTAGTVLTASNTATIHVTVTTAGAYNISSTISNGMIFSGFGTLATGTQTIILTGAGTPASPGTTNIPVTVGGSSCAFTINVGGTATPATYTIKCATAAVQHGTYTVGTALTAANTVDIVVDVATAGTYSITGTGGGMTFTASGTFAAAGLGQTVTLAGSTSSTPTTQGANSIPLTGGTASCNITVNVNPASGGAAVFAVNCASAVPNGTYIQNTALVASNTVTIGVNVTTAGTYTITAAGGGMTFTATGTFAATGNVNVTLNGSGTPTASGPATIQTSSGTTPCSFIINVNPAGGGAAVFTFNCVPAPSVAGTYTQGIALGASNTVSINVNVTTIGTYSISTTAVNGMIFSSAPGASFAATGAQSVTLTGSGNPSAGGMFNIQVPSAACTFLVYVGPGASATDYFPRVTNNNWSYEIDDVASDSLYRKVIPATLTVSSNTYNIFMQDAGTGLDSSGYYRRNGGDYFEYLDVAGFIGYDISPAFAEYTMLKDNVAAGSPPWTSVGFSGAIAGSPVTIRFSYSVIQKDVPITIVTSTGSISYQNVIVVQEKYEQFTGGVWVDLTPLIDFYGKSYYARGIGLIKYEPLNAAGVVQTGMMELRRYMVY
jgi:hypothetical protein